MNLQTLNRRVVALERQQRRARRGVVPSAIELFRLAWGEPDDWQAAILTSADPRLLLNCSRQIGKSTVAATIATHTALAVPGALCLLVAPSERQSGELYKKCLEVYDRAGRPIAPVKQNATELALRHGARIVALPGTAGTIRGFSRAALVVLDEAAWIMDATYRSVRPMLAVSGGRLIAASTPFGKRGWFYEAWAAPSAHWARVAIPAEQCPRIDPAFLDEERAALGTWYAQEYACAFLDVSHAVFSFDDIMGALSSDVAPLFGGV